MRIRSFVAWHRGGPDEEPGASLAGDSDLWRSWGAGPLNVRYAVRDTLALRSQGVPTTLLLGDDTEWDPAAPGAYLAAGVPLRVDARAQEVELRTSIVSLPPIFVYRGEGITAVASDLYLLTELPGVRLALDPTAVMELGHFGHPVERRTLFRNVEMVTGGSRMTLSARRGLTVSREWRLPDLERLPWRQLVEAQIDAFTKHLQRMNVSASFLSLTAGLDTRTVFAVLAADGRLVPAATITGPRLSLDARIAARLCRAYGVHHEPLTIDERFTRDLPRFVETASRLSGGIASLGQAPEIFMYDLLGGSYRARLSGNLGNQVGRGGTEGVSVRGANLSVLAQAFRASSDRPSGHWLLPQLQRDDREKHEFILQSEIPFTLVGNFTIGNHFAAQLTPYGSRTLIETLAARPTARAGAPSGSKLRMRMRDLRHRFLGEPEERSFQRTLVRRLGGYASELPINWGWKAAGGISASGMTLGAATLLGMSARAAGLDGGILRKPFEWSGLPALHDFRESRTWLMRDLADYTQDVLTSSAAREGGLFDNGALRTTLREHFRGKKDHYETITYALDLFLAQRAFCR
jgi:hypothetical protein